MLAAAADATATPAPGRLHWFANGFSRRPFRYPAHAAGVAVSIGTVSAKRGSTRAAHFVCVALATRMTSTPERNRPGFGLLSQPADAGSRLCVKQLVEQLLGTDQFSLNRCVVHK
jgi:hypothetical protein